MAWRERLVSVWERVLLLLFPPKCTACGALLPLDAEEGRALCSSCLAEWDNEARETCGICLRRVEKCTCTTIPMQKVRCAALRKLIYYRGRRRDAVQNRLIFRIKDTPDRHAIGFCAARLLPLLLEELETRGLSSDQCVVTYLPRSATAKAQTGTDQALELAREVSRLSGIGLAKLIRRRRGQTRKQKHLRYAERIQNAKATYALCEGRGANLGGMTVFLVDDIVTSGAGMAQGTRLLRRAGARDVICLSIAVDEINRERDVTGADFEEVHDQTP